MESLWPDDLIQQDPVEMPITILKWQASLLGKRTKNIVKGSVQRDIMPSYSQKDFSLTFHLIGPLLEDYHYSLFVVYCGIDPYPLRILPVPGILGEVSEVNEAGDIVVQDKEEFIKLLRIIFNSEKTRKVVNAIIAQSSLV